MPLLTSPNISHIDTVYFTHDGTITGNPVRVWWSDWASRGKDKSYVQAIDRTPYVYFVGSGYKGEINLGMPWCPSTLFGLLRGQAQTTTHYTGVFYHATLGTLSLTVEVLRVSAPDDEQWASGDPVENTRVKIMSFGAT